MTNEREPHRNGQCATGDSTPESVGEAWALFEYNGPKERLSQKFIDDIRDAHQLPSALELRVFGNAGEKLSQSSELAVLAQRDSALGKIVRQSDATTSFNYVIRGTLPGATNEAVAYKLGDVMNGIYYRLHDPNKPFELSVAYKRPGETEYVFTD